LTSDLFARLKSGTAQQHRAIETLIEPMKNFRSLDAYKAHLWKTWVFYRPLEAALAGLDWAALGLDFEPRRKTPLLERDLRVLGVPHAEEADGHRSIDPTNLDFAVGCLYVLEGATLGGQIISRHLATLGIGPENGARFFNGYGPRTGEMWKSFQAHAMDYCVTEDQMGEAVRGAQLTFGQFRDSMLREEPIANVA
jgi:heme oxygenase (biliverdin-IX-beta and delta-forming)